MRIKRKEMKSERGKFFIFIILFLLFFYPYYINCYSLNLGLSSELQIPPSTSQTDISSIQFQDQILESNTQILNADSLDSTIPDLSSIFTSTLPYISQISFTFPDPENPKKVKQTEMFDFYFYLVNDAFIPQFLLRGMPLKIYRNDILPPIADEISEDIYLKYQAYLDILNTTGVKFASPDTSPTSYVRTMDRSNIDSLEPVVVQYLEEGRDRNGNTVIAFLYKFLNLNLEITDFVYGSYSYDQNGNLKDMEVFKYDPISGEVKRYAMNIDVMDKGYEIEYKIGGISKLIRVENYREGDFNRNGFDDAGFNVVGFRDGNPTEAYNIELDDYSPGLGKYLGIFQVKVKGINSVDQIGFTYTRYIPEEDALVILNYSGLANPEDKSNELNKPEVTYIKNIPSGKLLLSFKSPELILREDMNFDLHKKILEIFNNHREELDYSIKLVEEASVYNFLSFLNEAGERKSFLKSYKVKQSTEGVNERVQTYSVNTDAITNFNFCEGFKEGAERYIQGHGDMLIEDTQYDIKADEDLIDIVRESYAMKENGVEEWRISKISINDRGGELRFALYMDPSVVDTILKNREMEPKLSRKSDYLLRVKNGNVIFLSGYAMQKEEGAWLPDNENLKNGLNIISEKAGIQIDSNIMGKIDEDTIGIIWDQSQSKLTQVTVFRSKFIQQGFAAFGMPWLFKTYEYSEDGVKVEKVGVGQIASDGSFLKPLFYLKPISENQFEVEHNLEIEAPLLVELLKYTGKIKEFEEEGEVELSLMQEVYDTWEKLALGKAGDSSLLHQIENAWPGYIELLKNEGKRAGFIVEVVETIRKGEKEIPTVIQIRKIETPQSKEILKIEVDKEVGREREQEENVLDRIVVDLKYGESPIEKTIIYSFVRWDTLTDYALTYYTQYKIFGGIYNVMVDYMSFTFDNLGRLRRYVESQLADAPYKIFLPYINPLAIGASDNDRALMNKYLLSNSVNLEEVFNFMKNNMEGLWLEREDINKPFDIKEIVDRDGDGVLGDSIEVAPELAQRGLDLGSIKEYSWDLLWAYISPSVDPDSINSWEGFLEAAINTNEIEIIYNSETAITSINEIKDKNGKLKPGNYTFHLQSGKDWLPVMGLEVDSEGVRRVNFIAPLENMLFTSSSITFIFPDDTGEDQEMRIWERNGSVEEDVFASIDAFISYLSEIQTSMENFTLEAVLNGRELEEKGVDITDLLLTMKLTGIRPILRPDKQPQTIFSTVSSNFLTLVNEFKTLAGIVQTCNVLDPLANKYFSDVQELKVNFWNWLTGAASGIFGRIGKQILDRTSALTGNAESDEGVIGRFPITRVYMNQNNISLQAYGAMLGATKLDFSYPLRGAIINKNTFQDENLFKNWVKAILGDSLTDQELDHLWDVYDDLVNNYGQPWMFYKFLRKESLTKDEIYNHLLTKNPFGIIWPGLSTIKGDPGDVWDAASKLWVQYSNYLTYTYDGRYRNLYPNASFYKELTFPQPGDDWAPRAGQLVLNEQVLKVKWSHLLSLALIAGSYFLTPYLEAAIISGAQGLATWLGFAERGFKIIKGLLSLPVAALNAVRISSQFVPFTTAMSLRKGVSWVEWFNQLGDQILHNAAYSFAFGMFFNPSLLGVEIGVLPAIGKLGEIGIRIGDKWDEGASLLHHIGGTIAGGLGRMWYWAGNYGDKLTKLIIGTQKTPLGEVARTTLSNPRYIFYLYLTESTIEEGLVPSIITWQLREGAIPGRTHIGGSRRLLATLARSQMLCTENAGNIAEMTDPLESPFFLALWKPFIGMLMDYHERGELDDYFKNLFTFLYSD